MVLKVAEAPWGPRGRAGDVVEVTRLMGRLGPLRYLLPLLLSGGALTAAVLGAWASGNGGDTGGINGFVEALSGSSSSSLGNLGLLAPLGFAFATGMASAVNPCGFAMLPAYIGLYLGSNDEKGGSTPLAQRLGRALLVGGWSPPGSCFCLALRAW